MSINQGLEKLNQDWSPALVGDTVGGLIIDIAPKRGEDSDDAWSRTLASQKLLDGVRALVARVEELEKQAAEYERGFWGRAAARLQGELSSARSRILELERQRDNLQAANNAELEKRRAAELKVEAAESARRGTAAQLMELSDRWRRLRRVGRIFEAGPGITIYEERD